MAISGSSTATSVGRATRPTLTRLDTSERIKAYDTVTTAAAAVRARQQAALTLSITPTTDAKRSDVLASSLPTASTSFVAAEIAHIPRPNKTAAHLTQDRRAAKRRESEPPSDCAITDEDAASIWHERSPASPPARTLSISSGALSTATFEPSEIVKNFLYLGPDISTSSEASYLKNQLGIKRILNAAWEIESGGGKHLRLDENGDEGFERYLKLPIKDTVEEKGVQDFIERACAFLDEASLDGAPTYVHCKAGKSRSVMLVMAYLIHSNGWSLQRSYAHVVECRRDVSPNIGFVAELMAFEEKRRKRGNSDGQEDLGLRLTQTSNGPGQEAALSSDRSSEIKCKNIATVAERATLSDDGSGGDVTPLARTFSSTRFLA